jgi:hypothetical protein
MAIDPYLPDAGVEQCVQILQLFFAAVVPALYAQKRERLDDTLEDILVAAHHLSIQSSR